MKHYILAFGLILALCAFQTLKQDKKFNIFLTEQEITTVLQGLGKLPLETAQPVYINILQQAQSQAQAQMQPKPQPKSDSTAKPKKN